MIAAALAWVGLCFGSFVNALVWRVHEQSLPKKKRTIADKDLSVVKGRSVCVNCGHALRAIDLVPVLSWISLRGRCRYCKKPISWQYPLVELITGVLYAFSYVFWPNDLHGLEIAYFALWLVTITGFMALIVYDLRWMLLPNRIIFPLYGAAGAMTIIRLVQEKSAVPLGEVVLSILIGGGLFYALFQFSRGKWIGGGDVKLGFLLGAIVAEPVHAMLVLFIASVLGTAAILPLYATGRMKRSTRVPFGPFLIAGTFIMVLFGADLIDWYIEQFLTI